MSESVDPLVPLVSERRLSGPTLAVLAFVLGTLFALLPMYYFYTTRGAAARTAAPSAPEPVAASEPAARESSRDTTARFAARMTYELSQTPAELPAVPLRVVAKAEPSAAAVPVAAPAPPVPARADPAPRVSNARPIIAAPLDARDTTREMEREARRPDYREPPRQLAQVTVDTPQPRVIEGRDFALPTKPVATRLIAAPDSEKRAVEAPNPPARAPVATAMLVPGANAIAPPPEAKAEKTKADAPQANGDALDSRLSATREWLSAAPQTTHTIQLMGTNSEEQLRNHIKALSKLVDPSKIYVIRTRAQGKPSMTVLYGAYPDRQAALQALEKLPPLISNNKPVLRTVNGIRAEQKQHGVDS